MNKEQFFSPLEIKFSGVDGDSMTFSGYGARFNNVDSYGDVIASGAFQNTIKKAKSNGVWPAMLLQHGGLGGDESIPVGIWTEMREDENGLYVEGKLADTGRGREAYSLLKMQPRPAISGMSIGYKAIEWTMRSKPDEPRRTLKSIQLFEISLVTFPANELARVETVKSQDSIRTIRDFERFLRDVANFSNAKAKAVAAHGFKAAEPRDEDGANVAEIIRKNIATLQT